jgi:hypothetical protein
MRRVKGVPLRWKSLAKGLMTRDPALPDSNIRIEAARLLDAARDQHAILRLIGGLAISWICPSAGRPPLARDYVDLDFATTAKDGAALDALMKAHGYEPDEMFNTVHGASRLYYHDRSNDRHVDVFVDVMQMCHRLRFSERIELMKSTLTPSDLLLTKLQIVQINHKDVLDLMALLYDQQLVDGAPDALDPTFLGTLWGRDWPLWRTSQLTLAKVRTEIDEILPEGMRQMVKERIAQLEEVLVTGNKSLAWRLRARIGDRLRWYELPEEIQA